MNDGNGHAVCFDAALIERYGGRGPRYTSYPTAMQFDAAFTAADYRTAAQESNRSGRPLSIYVHIPFCRSLCYYCGCNKIVTRNAARVQKYLDNLALEIEMQSALFDPARRVRQLHFGGGTPTYLTTNQMQDLMSQLGKGFAFETGSEREFSIEVDPRTVEAGSLAALAALGFNRLSLGIQDFDPDVQRAVNRVQSADDVDGLVWDARAADFKSISFDLIYGLPRQSVETFDRTLDIVLEMRPDRLAIYNYAHLPTRFKGQRMIADTDLPTPEEKLAILQHTIGRLAASDYVYIGMDHFALPDDDLARARDDGSLQRNFQGYSTHGDADLVGLGVSAISHVGCVYSQNTTSTIEYETIVSNGHLPVSRGVETDADDRLRAAVIQQLMCYDVLDLYDFGRLKGIDFHDYFRIELESLEPLACDGLIEIHAGRIVVTPKGRLLLRSIAMVFDRYLASAEKDTRYSRAI